MNLIERLKKRFLCKRYRIVKIKNKYFIQEQGVFGGWSNFMFDFYVYREAAMWYHNGWENAHKISFEYETFSHAKADLAFYLTYKNKPGVLVGYKYHGFYQPILLNSDIAISVTSTMTLYPYTLQYNVNDIIRLDDYEYMSVSEDEKYYKISKNE